MLWDICGEEFYFSVKVTMSSDQSKADKSAFMQGPEQTKLFTLWFSDSALALREISLLSHTTTDFPTPGLYSIYLFSSRGLYQKNSKYTDVLGTSWIEHIIAVTLS